MKILYTFNNGIFSKIRDVELLPDRYISINGNEAIPFEDVGDCALIDDDISPEAAFEIWGNAVN